jgi:hypothetical protein
MLQFDDMIDCALCQTATPRDDMSGGLCWSCCYEEPDTALCLECGQERESNEVCETTGQCFYCYCAGEELQAAIDSGVATFEAEARWFGGAL